MAQKITPYLLYEDCDAMLDWLAKAFGFKEVLRFVGEGGYVNHAEMELEGGTIYMGDPGDDFQNPRNGGYVGAQIAVEVDDVEAHFVRAKAAGAEIVQEPTDQVYGERRYDAKDPEGHLWSIAQPIRDVPAEEWGAEKSGSTAAN
jgi:PhnB protein